MRESEREERRKPIPTSKADRPKPNAAYEPYGSPNAQRAGHEICATAVSIGCRGSGGRIPMQRAITIRAPRSDTAVRPGDG